MARSKRPGWLPRLVHRLNDPKDGAAGWTVAACLLALEALLCALIIAKVPCEIMKTRQLSWQPQCTSLSSHHL